MTVFVGNNTSGVNGVCKLSVHCVIFLSQSFTGYNADGIKKRRYHGTSFFSEIEYHLNLQTIKRLDGC